jgi:hypothetical protein
MSVYRGLRVSRREVVLLRPDGTYCVQYLAQPLAPPTPPTPPPAEPDVARLSVARVALHELHGRRVRDAVARRLLREAGVIED